MLVPVLLILLAVASLSAWSSWTARTRLLVRLRAEWACPRNRSRDMEAISDFFRSQDAAGRSLDDRTWNDLLLDDVFAHIDRTESSVGQQVLYQRLRSAPRSLGAFEALIARAVDDADRRERAQAALARLHDSSGYYVHRLARPDALDRRWWHVVFPLWSAAVVLTLSLAFVWPKLLLVAVLGFVVNFAIRIATGRRVGREIDSFRQVGPLLSSAHALTALGTEETAEITGSLPTNLVALRRLGAIARWVSRDPLTTPDLVFAALEYLNVLLLMDANALYFAGRELQSRAPHLLSVIEAVGEIDAAIAIASFRTGARRWTRPRLVAPDAPAVLTDLCHPLIDEAVPNSIALAPPHGVLVTGSNMSGKSTFLRTVGVNVVLAQTINTCLARAYEAPVYQVRSCIGRTDDLLAGKSYFLVEVESVLALVSASEHHEPHLFIFDELFRGTNAVERIAAAEAVLGELIGGGKPHVVLVPRTTGSWSICCATATSSVTSATPWDPTVSSSTFA
jgi:MutS-like protein